MVLHQAVSGAVSSDAGAGPSSSGQKDDAEQGDLPAGRDNPTQVVLSNPTQEQA